MREVTMYESDDGVLWRVREHAEARDAEVRVAREIDSILPPAPRPLRGWIQHDSHKVALFRSALVMACKKLSPGDHYDGHPVDVLTHPGSFASRIMSERGGPLGSAWGRANRIDEHGREWEQCYFVMNQEKGLKEFPGPCRP